MKTLQLVRHVDIPEGYTCGIKSRVVTITNDETKETISKSFRHLKVQLEVVQVDVIDKKTKKVTGQKTCLRGQVWMGKRRMAACLRTVTSHVENMITGLQRGYQYKMRLVYNHFPIQAELHKVKTKENPNPSEPNQIQILNFLGEKIVRIVNLPKGVTCRRSDVKDELIFEGADVEAVSQSAAKVHDIAAVKNKDIRKFLDGVYVSAKGFVRDLD